MSEIVSGLFCELFIGACLLFYAAVALALVVWAIRGEFSNRRRADSDSRS